MDTYQIESPKSQNHHRWYIYVLIILASMGIALLVGYLFIQSPMYTNKAEEALSEVPIPTEIPGMDIPLIKNAINELPMLEEQSLAEPANASVFRKKAQNYIMIGELQNAVDAYNNEAQINNDDPTLFFELGNVYTQLQESEKAIEAYDKSIEIDPTDNESFMGLANIYTIQIPNREKVIESYTRSIESNPENTTFRILFASFYEQVGEDSLALQQYQGVLRVDPNNTIAKNKVEQLSDN